MIVLKCLFFYRSVDIDIFQTIDEENIKVAHNDGVSI